MAVEARAFHLARTIERRPRALSLWALLICFALVIVATVLLASSAAWVSGGTVAVFAGALVICSRLRDTRRNRLTCLLLSLFLGCVAVGIVALSGDRGVPLLLVSAAIVGAITFGRSHAVKGCPGQRRFRPQKFSLYEAALVATGPAFAGGAVLISHHELTGSGLVALVTAPWLLFAPTVRVFVDSSTEDAERRYQRAQDAVTKTTRRELHQRVWPSSDLFKQALKAATDAGASSAVLTRLTAAERAWLDLESRARTAILRHSATGQRLTFLTGGTADEAEHFADAMDAGPGTSAENRQSSFVHRLRLRSTLLLDEWSALRTNQMDRICLVITLWLRAGLVAGAPSLAYVSLSPDLPSRYVRTDFANDAWLVIAAWTVVVAALSPLVIEHVMGAGERAFRRALLAIETPMAVGLLLLKPSWPTAIFLAGVWNWLQRPQWRTSRMLPCALLLVLPFVGGVALDSSGWTVWRAVFEVAIALSVTSLVAVSYGLMLPLLIRAAIALPLELRVRRWVVERGVRKLVVNQGSSILHDTEEALRPLLMMDPADTSLRRALARVEDAQRELGSPAHRLRRAERSFSLDRTLLDGISSIVPLLSTDRSDERDLYSFKPEVDPDLHALSLSYRDELALKNVLGQVAREAKKHGQGWLATQARKTVDGVEVLVANEVRPDREPGHGEGANIIKEAVNTLPEGKLVDRGERPAPFPLRGRAWVVRFSFRPRDAGYHIPAHEDAA